MAIEREEITAAGSKIIVAWEAQYLVGEPLGQPLGHVLGFRFSLEPVALFPSVRDDVLDGLDFVLGKVQGRTEGSKLLVGPCVLPLGKFEHAGVSAVVHVVVDRVQAAVVGAGVPGGRAAGGTGTWLQVSDTWSPAPLQPPWKVWKRPIPCPVSWVVVLPSL